MQRTSSAETSSVEEMSDSASVFMHDTTDVPRSKKRKLFTNYAELFDLVGLPWALLTVTGCTYLGYVIVLPDVYAGWPDWWHVVLNCLVTVLLIETLVNWFFLRYVTSYFDPRCISVPELQLLSREGDAQAVYINNPHNKALPRDDCNTDVMLKFREAMLCAVDVKTADGRSRLKMYPYLSWRPCVTCNTYRPPRAHHCPLCKRCVLKRDHHCFFSGTCVGLRNQRFFIVFCMWTMLLTLFATLHSFLYIYLVIWDELLYLDFFLPFTVFRWLMAETDGIRVFMVVLFYGLLFIVFTTTNYFFEQCDLLMIGINSYEHDNEIKIADTRSLEDKLASVFGKHWWVSFIVPFHRCNPVNDDGMHWPTLKKTVQ